MVILGPKIDISPSNLQSLQVITNLEAKNNYFWVKKYGWDQNYIFGWPKSLISKPEYYFYEYDKIEIKNAIKKGKIKQNKDKNISNEKYCIEYEVAYEGHLAIVPRSESRFKKLVFWAHNALY